MIPSLAEKTYYYIKTIVDDFGSRPAGSNAESDTIIFIEQKLIKWGYSTQHQQFLFASLPILFLPYGFMGLILVICGWVINQFPYLSLSIPFLFYVLPFYSRLVIKYRKKDKHSQNIFSDLCTDDPKTPLLILSAHVDSARASYFSNPKLLIINYFTLFIAQRVAIALAMFALIVIFGVSIPVWIKYILLILCTITGGWLFFYQAIDQLFHRNRYSPGANDNASGVAILLSIAENYATRQQTNPYQHLQLAFLFTGAEETGLHGADAFSLYLSGRENVSILCLDMVGCGNNILYISGDGTISSVHTNPFLNQIMKDVHPDITPIWYTVRSGDFAAFARNGIPTAAIQTKASVSKEIAYHTIHDKMDIIDKATLEKVLQLVISFIERYDQQWNLSKGASPFEKIS